MNEEKILKIKRETEELWQKERDDVVLMLGDIRSIIQNITSLHSTTEPERIKFYSLRRRVELLSFRIRIGHVRNNDNIERSKERFIKIKEKQWKKKKP